MDNKKRRRMDRLGTVLIGLGCAAITAGISLLCIPAGLIWLGGWMMALGLLYCRAAGRDSA